MRMGGVFVGGWWVGGDDNSGCDDDKVGTVVPNVVSLQKVGSNLVASWVFLLSVTTGRHLVSEFTPPKELNSEVITPTSEQ